MCSLCYHCLVEDLHLQLHIHLTNISDLSSALTKENSALDSLLFCVQFFSPHGKTKIYPSLSYFIYDHQEITFQMIECCLFFSLIVLSSIF